MAILCTAVFAKSSLVTPRYEQMVQRIEIRLSELRALRSRIDDRDLELEDWPIIEALVNKLIGRAESQQERMAAKIAAQRAADASIMEASSSQAASSDGVSSRPAIPQPAPTDGTVETHGEKKADECTDLLDPLFRAIEQHGIHNAVSLRIDDTGSEVIELRKQIRAEIAALEKVGESTKDVRTAINATGVYLETADGAVITLFYTGRHHAGEIIDQLLKHRKSTEPKLAKVTDGASKNFDHRHADKLIESSCNAHAYLKFRAIKDKYPDEYATAAEVYKQVFDNDDEANALKLTPDERMLFHREHSKPLMEKLKAMCDEKIESRLVEPNSLLWEPLTFIINQWTRLTLFYKEPNVPLDTNLVEQTLIIPVRYLAGSFNYKNTNGSETGDLCMSLVATARANGVEPVAYLTHCLAHHEDLARNPQHYLPWVYRERHKE